MTEDIHAGEHEPDEEPVAEPTEELEDESTEELEDETTEEPAEPTEPEARGPTAAELKRFETENTRHEKALAKIIGRDWEGFAACAECGGVGFVPAATLEAPELLAMPGVVECPGCKGYGRLVTPSRVPGQEFQTCVQCAGNGWKHEEPAQVAAPAYAPPLPGNGAPSPYPGHILVKVDPNAPDIAVGAQVGSVDAPTYAP